MKKYIPTKVDIDWAKNIVALTGENAVWVWPDTGLIYSFSHSHKTLTLLNQELIVNKFIANAHNMTVEVFAKVGYNVVLKGL